MNKISRKYQSGFTLVELLVATLLSAVILTATYMVFFSQQMGYIMVDSHADKLQTARQTVDRVTRMVRQAGLDVVTGQVILEAKQDRITFRGDVDTDVEVTLAQSVTAGATAFQVDLVDEVHNVDTTDFVLIQQGSNTELIPVRQFGGPAVNLEGEPDTIYLSEGLENSYDANLAKISTVEMVNIAFDLSNHKMEYNSEIISQNVMGFKLAYFDEAGNEMTIPTTGLSLTDRLAVRRIDLEVDVRSASGRGSDREHTMSVEPRNIARPSRNNEVVAPAAPTSPQVVDNGTCGHFTVIWTPPTQNADGTQLEDLAGYRIYFGPAPGDYYDPPFPVIDETQEEATVTDFRLAHGQTYYVAVAAYDAGYNESLLSVETSFVLNDQTPPPTPGLETVFAENGNVTLNWNQNDAADDIYGYRIYRGTEPASLGGSPVVDETTLDNSAFTYADSDVAACRIHYYRIVAVDCVNESEPTDLIFGDGEGVFDDFPDIDLTNTTPEEIPAIAPAPVKNAVAIGGQQKIVLSWINPADPDLAAIIVRWSVAQYPQTSESGNELDIYEGNASEAMTVEHSGLIDGQPYFYSIFAVDGCGNVSAVEQITAIPNNQGPVIEILEPFDGAVITNGKLTYQAVAYDADNSDLSAPPNVVEDNGKGIVSVTFRADPLPGSSGLPKTSYNTEYCAFGSGTVGDSCSAGDISNWCDGPYNLLVEGLDDEGVVATSPYITVNVQNGGLYLDETFSRYTSGDFRQIANFQIENTSINSLTVNGLQPTWDRSYARLARIEIPSGNVIWEDFGAPAVSGQQIDIEDSNRPMLTAGQKVEANLTFVRWSLELDSFVSQGDTRIYVEEASNYFGIGDTLWLNDGANSEAKQVVAVSTTAIELSTGLLHDYSAGTTVASAEDVNNARMSSADLNVVFDYQKDILADQCRSASYDLTLVDGPDIVSPQQDLPDANTPSSETVGAIAVANNSVVPVHGKVVDNSAAGIANVRVFFTIDTGKAVVAPQSGYQSILLTFSSFSGNYEGTLPAASNARIWYYFTAEDNNGQDSRLPSDGAFVYDAQSTGPACPQETKVKVKRRLCGGTRGNISVVSWDAVAGADHYNVYRLENDDSWVLAGSTADDTFDDCGSTPDDSCYEYIITAVDSFGAESTGCTDASAPAGNCK